MKKSAEPSNFTPDIPLSSSSLRVLTWIFRYTKTISILIDGIDDLEAELSRSISLQQALLFNLKAIAICVELAAIQENNTIDQMPKFWKDMHYLRNTLIHHCLTTRLIEPEIICLAKICRNIGHVYNYFSLVCDRKNTQVDLRGQKYKVFLDMHELQELLIQRFPKDQRATTTQQSYLHTVFDALVGIELLSAAMPTTASELPEFIRTHPRTYYALQNLLELVATLMNPNPEYSLISQATRDIINRMHPEADEWLRELGKSRAEAMHRSIIIQNRAFIEHIQTLHQFKQQVLLVPLFQSQLNISFNPPVQGSSSSTQMLQAMLPTISATAAAAAAAASSSASTSSTTSSNPSGLASSSSPMPAPPPTASLSGLPKAPAARRWETAPPAPSAVASPPVKPQAKAANAPADPELLAPPQAKPGGKTPKK